jgi:ATP-dependent helicase/nuclease subunit B
VVAHICEEFKQSHFDPAYCELDISKDGIVPPLITDFGEGRMVLNGQVDRVDIYNNNIRIVDYKSGGKTFALSDTLAGLNLQMLIYLYAIIKNGSKIVSNPKPAGILYMQGASASKSAKLTMNGIILDDDKIIEAMEADKKGVYIPKKTKNSTTYIDEETFTLIFDNIDKQIKAMGTQIRSGEFTPNPIRFNEFSSSCTFCDYANICRSKNKNFREIEKVSFANFKNHLKGGEDSGI